MGALGMGKELQFKQDTVLEAITNSYGVINTVSKRLKCSWCTAKKYIQKWEKTREAFKQETEIILDIAETVIFESVENGDIATAKWILSTKGASRGYCEGLEIQPEKKDIEIKIIMDN